MTAEPLPLLELENLTHRFPDGTIGIDRVNMRIRGGELIVLAGRNGSGKTVLMLHMNGLLKPTGGRVLFEGIPIEKNLPKVRQRVGIVFQEPENQIVGQTVEEDVAFGPENIGLSREEVTRRVSSATAEAGIVHLIARPSKALSGGEKRKLAIAGVLALRPDIVVLDEPFAGLDYPGVRDILGSIIGLFEAGHSVVVITHDIEKLLAHATRLVLMAEGRVVRDGDPAEVVREVEAFGVRGAVARTGDIRDLTWLK